MAIPIKPVRPGLR